MRARAGRFRSLLSEIQDIARILEASIAFRSRFKGWPTRIICSGKTIRAILRYGLGQSNPGNGPYESATIIALVGHFVETDTFLWTWIGTHEDYNKL
jgi:hypothetical protein